MNIQKSLQNFIEQHLELNRSLNELRNSAKEEGSKMIQQLVQDEKFSEAEKLIRELDKFTKLSFVSNIEELTSSAKVIFENQKEFQNTSMIREEVKKDSNKEVTYEENNLIKILGTTGISRIKDMDVEVKQSTVKGLYEKNLVDFMEENWGEYKETVLFLTEEGQKFFKVENETSEIKKPFFLELKEKHGNIAKGYFINETKLTLKTRGFLVDNMNGNEMEVTKNEITLYLTLINENIEYEECIELIENKNHFKNIGFVCANNSILEKLKRATVEWTKNNEHKSRYLSVNLTSIDEMPVKPSMFETLSY